MDSKSRLLSQQKSWWTTLLMGAATLASAVTFTRAVGLVNNGANVSAQAFVVGDDGNLWLHLINWRRLLGEPRQTARGEQSGLALATGQDGISDPLAYILGSDGNV